MFLLRSGFLSNIKVKLFVWSFLYYAHPPFSDNNVVFSFQSMILADHYVTNHVGGADKVTSTHIMNMGQVAGGLNTDHIDTFPKEVYWWEQ